MDSELTATLARIEQRQAAYEVVAHRLIGMLEIHNEKLDAILEAATVEPGPSPTTEVLQQILATMQAADGAAGGSAGGDQRDHPRRDAARARGRELEWSRPRAPSTDADEDRRNRC